MPYTPVQSSAHISFATLANLRNYAQPGYQNRTIPEKLKTHLYLEQQVVSTCRKHGHQPELFPIIFNFSLGINTIFLTTGISAKAICDDIVHARKTSLTYGELRRKQFDFLMQSRHCVRFEAMDMNSILAQKSIRQKMDMFENILAESKTDMTLEEYDTLGMLARQADDIKDNPIIMMDRYKQPSRPIKPPPPLFPPSISLDPD